MWKRWWFWVVLLIVIGLASLAAVKIATRGTSQSSSTASTSPVSTTTTDSVAVKTGKHLTDKHCSGTGTVPLNYAPMKSDQIASIQPYGLTVGGHVTPVDHEYYWAKNNVKDANDVIALADGTLSNIEYRDHHGQGPIPGDYRVVISYTCTFMSYFDLATSLAPDIAAQLPGGWEKDGRTDINIPVKAGQVIAKMGGQTLDFAIWDMTKNNPKLLDQTAYLGEEWKTHTVAPLDYFSAAVKAEILPFYVRQAEPRDGYYAYDVAGKLIGTWFLKGSGGYDGPTGTSATTNYWAGHLAIAPNYIDPTVFGFSIGNYQGEATQFLIKPPVADPATIGVESGVVKLELLPLPQYSYVSGGQWDGMSTPTGPLTIKATGAVQATALLQLTDASTLKVELFPGKTATQVTAFDAGAKTYTRSGK